MANFCLTHAARNAVIYSTALACTITGVRPICGFQDQPLVANLKNVNTAIKLEKLIEKAWKYFKASDSKTLSR